MEYLLCFPKYTDISKVAIKNRNKSSDEKFIIYLMLNYNFAVT